MALRQVFINLRPKTLQGFCLGGLAILKVLNLVRYRVIDTFRIWSPTGLNTPHPLPATHCPYILYFDTGKGGGWELNQREG
jgi:hypothetical protein